MTTVLFAEASGQLRLRGTAGSQALKRGGWHPLVHMHSNVLTEVCTKTTDKTFDSDTAVVSTQDSADQDHY